MDVALNDRGVSQAKAWREVLRPPSFGCIYCSDLERTRSTAQIISYDKRAHIIEMPGLREIHLGSWDGRTRQEIEQLFPGAWEKRGRDIAGFRPEGGESFADLSRRAMPLFETIVNTDGDSILIVTHAGVIRVIVAQVLGMPLENIFSLCIGYGSLSTLIINDRRLAVKTLNLVPGNLPV